MYCSPCITQRLALLRSIHTTPTLAKKLKIPDPNIPKKPHIPTPKEIELQYRRRVEKAERDERMDISMSLTEVKTYEGGFTKPRVLRASNWFPGGEYIRKGKVYEIPVDAAYRPHTVFILESRYSVKTKETGRPDVPEHIVRVIGEEKFLPYVKHVNSSKATGSIRLSMDSAWWPFLGRRRIRQLEPDEWWNKGEDPRQLRLEALGFSDTAPPPEPLRQYYPDTTQYRNNGTKVVGVTPTKTIVPPRGDIKVGEIRQLYEPIIEKESFWRPLISVTLATRPLANTLVRLCRALPRGLPFYASIDPDDRKNQLSFPDRMRLLRLRRLRQLTIDMAKRLEGYYGGFIGIRFDKEDRGRAIQGERLSEPLPDPLRVIRVGIGHWYAFEKELELWKLEAFDAGVNIDLAPMDDWGRRLDSGGQVMPGQEIKEGVNYFSGGSEEDDFEDEGDGEDEDEDEDEGDGDSDDGDDEAGEGAPLSRRVDEVNPKEDRSKGGVRSEAQVARPVRRKASSAGA